MTIASSRAEADRGRVLSNHRRQAGKDRLFDISRLDLSAAMVDKAGLERVIPHRGMMSLLDRIIWHAPDFTRSVAAAPARIDDFWAAGHYPGRPMMPGVIMVEAGAQLAAFAYNIRQDRPKVAAFTRIDECVFRASVEPPAELVLLCQEVKFSPRRFVSTVQGLIDGKIAFEATVSGMSIGEMDD